MTPDLLTQFLNTILASACECLNENGFCPCPCRAFISAGPPVWDMEACCSDGQLTVHVDRLYAHGNFPSEQGLVNVCIPPLAAEIVVTLLRCFPSVRDDGTAPTSDALGAASEDIYQDLYTLTGCLLCSLSQRGRMQQSVFRGSRILPPQGGCIGVELRFVIQLSDPLA